MFLHITEPALFNHNCDHLHCIVRCIVSLCSKILASLQVISNQSLVSLISLSCKMGIKSNCVTKVILIVVPKFHCLP